MPYFTIESYLVTDKLNIPNCYWASAMYELLILPMSSSCGCKKCFDMTQRKYEGHKLWNSLFGTRDYHTAG